ncbi:MAG: LysR family transcriptional regulator [Bdellovibrio sp.]|nr:LysR family transcriptional regulator [Bdellovibrio sp.]
MQENLSWDLFKSYLAVVKEKTLSGAAKSLGIAQPTVGRHIDTLEQELKVSLFTRSQTGFIPTEAGLRLLPYAESIASNATALVREVSEYSDAIEGTVRVTASEVISVEVLPAIFSRLQSTHPGLKIEMVASNQAKNLLDREADIAVRMFKPTQQSLVIRKVGEIEFGWHAHKDYLKRQGVPKTEGELKDHSLIGFDQETDFVRSFKAKIGNIERSDLSLRTDNDLVQLAAIRSGFGIGVCQIKLAQRDSNLVRVLPKQIQPKLTTWVTMHENLKSTARYRAVFAELVKGLSEYLE